MSPARRAGAAKRHAKKAPRPIRCVIITVSDTRRGVDDVGGEALAALVRGAGHEVVKRAWARDDVAAIRRAVKAGLAAPRVDAVLVTGGTGIAPRDVTPEAVAPLVSKWLPGFGERFRALSQAGVGNAAWLSRAEAGVGSGRLIVLLPGSPHAVDLAMRRVLLPGLAHVIRLLGRFDREE